MFERAWPILGDFDIHHLLTDENGGFNLLLEWVLLRGWIGCGEVMYKRVLFLFMILICSVLLCISRWKPSRSRAWLVLAIEWDLLPKGLLVLGLGNKRLCKIIESWELWFPQTVSNCYDRNMRWATNSQNRSLPRHWTLAKTSVTCADKKYNWPGRGCSKFLRREN